MSGLLQPYRLGAVTLGMFDRFMGASEGSDEADDWGAAALGLCYQAVLRADQLQAGVPWRVMSALTWYVAAPQAVRRKLRAQLTIASLANSRGVLLPRAGCSRDLALRTERLYDKLRSCSARAPQLSRLLDVLGQRCNEFDLEVCPPWRGL